MATLSLLCLLSLTWKYLRQSSGLRLVYALSFGFTLASTAIFYFEAGMSSLDRYGVVRPSALLLASALAILGAAASLIIIISALVERARNRSLTPEPVASSTPVPNLRDEIRRELRDLAFRGELMDMLLQTPFGVERLKEKLDALEASKSDASKGADSAL